MCSYVYRLQYTHTHTHTQSDKFMLCSAAVAAASSVSAAVDCGEPPQPGDGTGIAVNGSTYLKVAYYECNTGYGLNGAQIRRCLASQQWSGIMPTCECKYIPCAHVHIVQPQCASFVLAFFCSVCVLGWYEVTHTGYTRVGMQYY